MSEGLRDEITKALSKGPLKRAELFSQCSSAKDLQQLSNTLHGMKLAGLVDKNDDGHWILRAARSEKTKPRAELLMPAVTQRAAAETPAERSDTEAVLEQGAARAQAALDDYLASVADPKVVAPLKAARDLARQALDNYRRSKNAA